MPDNNPQQQQTLAQQQTARAAEGANRAAERLEQSAEHATSVAIDKVRQAREQAQSGIEQQRAQVADRVRRVGDVLRSGSQSLSLDDPLSQQIFEVAGDSIGRIAEYIDSVSPGELANDVQALARRRPGLFFGGTFILGLALGRFAKSTSASEPSGGSLEREGPEEEASSYASAAPRTPAATSPSYGARSAPSAQPLSPSHAPRRVDDGEGTKS